MKSDDDSPDDSPEIWTLEIYDDEGVLVSREEIQAPPETDEPFNSDGLWKAVLLQPDGRSLRTVPLIAILTETEGGPPHGFIMYNDTAVDCATVPGFICAGTMDLEGDALMQWLLDCPDLNSRVANWMVIFENRRLVAAGEVPEAL
jgi:hypothetical protein